MTAITERVPARDVPARRTRFEYSFDDLPRNFVGDPIMSYEKLQELGYPTRKLQRIVRVFAAQWRDSCSEPMASSSTG